MPANMSKTNLANTAQSSLDANLDLALGANISLEPSISLEPNISYEAAVAELEAIVAKMESGELALDASLKAYKRGAELVHLCQKTLLDAEQQVRILTDANKLAAFNDADN